MSHIFISYSHADKEYAHQLAAALEQMGFIPWLDDRIDYGTRWPLVIQEHLDGCAAFIVIMTPRAYQSEWVQNELAYAAHLRKPRFPLLLEGSLWASVAALQVTDVRGGALPPRRFYETLARFAPREARQTQLGLPLLEWCDIPAGEVVIEGQCYHVKAFRLAKHPVTNLQFQAFINDPNGYANLAWWDYARQARLWRSSSGYPAEPTFAGDARPREMVSWFEALAYCRWLSHKYGLMITLPTEAQWQRAAQGNDGREYPWGQEFGPNLCNTREFGPGETTPVDTFPPGAFDLRDMAGNVFEWCLNTYDHPETGDLEDGAIRVLRGGSWEYSAYWARTTARYYGALPHERFNTVGFRVMSAG